MSIKDMPHVTVEAVSALRTEAIELEQQRDELLAALKVMRERHQVDSPHHADICEYCKQADSIINKVEAEK